MSFSFFKETYAKTLNFKTPGFFLQHPLCRWNKEDDQHTFENFVIISSPVINDDPDYENEIDKDFDEDIEA